MSELPPRTRRIQIDDVEEVINRGTTSAHAENTHHWWGQLYHRRNYLRARGEYGFQGAERFDHRELPPRTRRIRPLPQALLQLLGTTSAHAENTLAAAVPASCARNYLRARGEYHLAEMISKGLKELPPRTRRIQTRSGICVWPFGTTSAHAENTICFSFLLSF